MFLKVMGQPIDDATLKTILYDEDQIRQHTQPHSTSSGDGDSGGAMELG